VSSKLDEQLKQTEWSLSKKGKRCLSNVLCYMKYTNRWLLLAILHILTLTCFILEGDWEEREGGAAALFFESFQMKYFYTPKRTRIRGWFAFGGGGCGWNVVLLHSECLSSYRAAAFCIAGSRADVTGLEFSSSTGDVRGSNLGHLTIIFGRMSGGFLALLATGFYRHK
jgi:hypothetical protein